MRQPYKRRESYPIKNAHPLLDAIKAEFGPMHDIELSKALGMCSMTCALIRNGQRANMTDEIILNIHETTGWSIERIKSLIPPHQRPKPYGTRR